jgi:hypothetical protein
MFKNTQAYKTKSIKEKKALAYQATGRKKTLCFIHPL